MLGILPAGGQAMRFGGAAKDLLPIGDEVFPLSSACRRAMEMGADHLLIVTSTEKAALHERFIQRHLTDFPITLAISSNQGLWEAIRVSFAFREESLLVLPDTVFTVCAAVPKADLAFGVFPTDEPERFSVIRDNTIVTKQPGPPSLAWGCVTWSKAVVEYWQAGAYPTYDDAFRSAMGVFGHSVFPITDYHDLGTWAAYQRYIAG